MFSKDKINKDLDTADLNPVIKRELREVVREIAEYVPNEIEKGMMYDLVHVIAEMDERIRDLESRVCESGPKKEVARMDWVRTRIPR